MSASSHILSGYIYSISQLPGVVGPNNYLSLMNPSTSVKRVIIVGLFLSNSLTNPSAVTEPMRGWRISAATGGTQVTDLTTISKIQTQDPDPGVELRVGNPTCTLKSALFNSPPQLETRTSNVHDVELPPGIKPFTLLPGEGIALRCENTAGATIVWNVTVVWAEVGR